MIFNTNKTDRRQQPPTPRDPNKFPATQLFLLGESSPRRSRIAVTNFLNHIALVRVAEPIALTSIFPYAWVSPHARQIRDIALTVSLQKLVLHFHVGAKENASFYAGLLISAFALAESITGM